MTKVSSKSSLSHALANMKKALSTYEQNYQPHYCIPRHTLPYFNLPHTTLTHPIAFTNIIILLLRGNYKTETSYKSRPKRPRAESTGRNGTGPKRLSLFSDVIPLSNVKTSGSELHLTDNSFPGHVNREVQ